MSARFVVPYLLKLQKLS